MQDFAPRITVAFAMVVAALTRRWLSLVLHALASAPPTLVLPALFYINRSCMFAALLVLFVLALAFSRNAIAQESTDSPVAQPAAVLHERIDELIKASTYAPALQTCSDAEFLRRIYLDLHGTIPTADESRQFLADAAPDKRSKLVDQLLADPRYSRYMSNVFDVMLMERRPDKRIKREEWTQYLLDAFVTNKPYHELAREILAADGADEKLRPAAKFYLDREAEPNLLTRDVGRVFFGMDLQCAQCHNHPNIDSYFQKDYYGLFAFFSRGLLFTDKEKKYDIYAEKGEGVVKFTSVFTGDSGESGPFLPGDQPVEEPTFPAGEEYTVKPDKDVRPIPKYSRRAKLAELVAAGTNKMFRRNIANRLWAHMMGKGLVHPVDLHHDDNLASHPQLLDLLGDEFATMNFDIKAFLRELALSQVYQRAFDLPGNPEQFTGLQPRVDELTAARQAAEQQVAQWEAKRSDVAARLAESSSQLQPLKKTLQETTAGLAEKEKPLAELTPKVAALQTLLTQQKTKFAALQEASVASAKAAAVLPEDEPLKQAAQFFATRAAALEPETQKSEAAFNEQDAVLKKMVAEVDALQAQQVETQAALQPILKVQAELAAESRQISEQFQSAKAGLNRIGGQLELTSGLVNFLAAQQQFQSLQSQLNALLEQQRTLLAQRSQLQTQVGQLDGDLKKATDSLQTAQSQMNDLQGKVKSAGAGAEAFAQALSDLQKAAALLETGADLEETVAVAAAQVARLNANRDTLVVQYQEAEKRVTENNKMILDTTGRLESARAELVTATAVIEKTQPELDSLQNAYAQQTLAFDEIRTPLSAQMTRQLTISELKALNPEQLAWSTMQATGIVTANLAAVANEYDTKNAIDDAKRQDAAVMIERAKQIEAGVYAKLKSNEAIFVKLFGAGSGQPQDRFFATVDQALYLSNGGAVVSWIGSGATSLVGRTAKLENAQQIAEEIYLSVLTRMPTAEEVRDIEEFLQASGDQRAAAVTEISWALLTSSEFRFCH